MGAPDPRLTALLSEELQAAFRRISKGEMKGDGITVCDSIAPAIQAWYDTEHVPVGYVIAEVHGDGAFRILDEGADLSDEDRRVNALAYWRDQLPEADVVALRLVRA